MTLGELLEGVKLRQELPSVGRRGWLGGGTWSTIRARVEKGFVFFAFPGSRVDGRRFAPQAREQGAIAVVCDDPRPAGFRRTVDSGRATATTP